MKTTPKKLIVAILFAILSILSLCSKSSGSTNASIGFLEKLTLSPFGSYRASELDKQDGRLGAGLALGYELTKSATVEASALSERYTERPLSGSIAESSAVFKGYLPIWSSGLLGYGLIGYSRRLADHNNAMLAGAGLEVRGRIVAAFADGAWRNDFSRPGEAIFRLGLRFNLPR
jgi:hypothetical protein